MLIATSGTGSIFMNCMVPGKPTVISMKLADNKETLSSANVHLSTFVQISVSLQLIT